MMNLYVARATQKVVFDCPHCAETIKCEPGVIKVGFVMICPACKTSVQCSGKEVHQALTRLTNSLK